MVGSELVSCGFSTCVRQEKGFVHVGSIRFLGARYFVQLVEGEMTSGADTGLPFVVGVDSRGGDFHAAIRMTRAVRGLAAHRPVRIEVLAGGRCESMCTVLWAAASERVAAPEARFMFHGPASGPRRKPGAGLKVNAAAMEHVIRRVDPVLADFLKARQAFVPAGPKVELPAAEIAALGGDYLRLDPALR